MKDVSYGMTKNIGIIDFERAQEKVTEALKTEGFGVLTEIDVQSTLKKKLDVDMKKYKILGACNPQLAYESIKSEPMIGLLLPCNVIIFEEEDQTITVSIVDPLQMFKVVDNEEMKKTAGTVNVKLKNVLEQI